MRMLAEIHFENIRMEERSDSLLQVYTVCMPHIHTEPGQHDHTVSAYIVRYIDDVPHLLLHRHKKYRKLMQPGGHVELDENPWQAVLHEIPEETGYDPAQLHLLQPYRPFFTTAERRAVTPLPFLANSHDVRDGTIEQHYHDDSVYVFVTQEPPARLPGEGETQEIEWLTQEQIQHWDQSDMAFAVKNIAEAVFDGCLKNWIAVPLDTFSTQNP